MKISVVTAVYNRKATIAQAMQSVQEQTYDHVEHILQDGGSSDGTQEIIAGVAGPDTYCESAPDGGIYDAINKGIARATGDVIGLVHSDDYFAHNDVLGRIATAFADPDIDGVYGDLDYVTNAVPTRVVRHWKAGKMTRAKLQRGWMPPHPTLYLRRSVFEQFGTYDTSFQISADYDAMLRWFWTERLRLAYVPEVLVKMRVGGESNRSFGRIIQKSKEDYRALRRNKVGGATALAYKNLSKLSQFVPRKT